MLLRILASLFICCGPLLSYSQSERSFKWPTIGVSILVRNKAHTLPYFFSCLHNLDYPKDRMYLWIHSDYNADESNTVIENWVNKHGVEYNSVHVNISTDRHLPDSSPTYWSENRFKHVIELRDRALHHAKKHWADYLLMIDADVFLVEKNTLKNLVKKNLTVVSPMLISDGIYSNFWCGMSENFYYERTQDYKPILNRENIGCFNVPMVHSAVLIDLLASESENLTYNPAKILNYKGPIDDIIAFALSAKKNGVSMHVCNEKIYGYLPVPLEDTDSLETDFEQLLNIKLEALSKGTQLPLDTTLREYVRFLEPWKYNCDEIFMINLKRRAHRRHLMTESFKELGMEVTIFDGVDGQGLNEETLQKMSVTLMPEFEDPYHKRPMKMGEVGCFLSHYNIWKKIVEKGHSVTLVLEDDIHFVPYFRNKFTALMNDLRNLDWDLVYIGRKVLQNSQEERVTEQLVRPLYSYWTLGYLLSGRGAQKLLDAKPLDNMLPVDEFLPIMFNQHNNDTWKNKFRVRNLVALSADPLLIHPSHYTGEEGYISDTEDSPVVTNNPLPPSRSDL